MTTRILTYNIWNYSGGWRIRRQLLLEEIGRAQADVVALQEVRHSLLDLPGRNQAGWIGEQLGYHVLFRAAQVYWPAPPVVEGLAFMTRLPIDQWSYHAIPYIPGSGPHRVILHIRTSGVDYYNVHFPLTERARTLAALHLIETVHSTSGRTIALGDFNADTWQPPMKRLFQSGFTDLWERLRSSGHGGDRWPKKRRIDYILSYGVTPVKGVIRVVGDKPHGSLGYASDHVGVLTEVDYE